MQYRSEKLLQAVLDTDEFRSFYSHLRQTHHELNIFPEYSDLTSFLNDQTNYDYQSKDRLFKILINNSQASHTELINCFLMVILYPGLNVVFKKRMEFFSGDQDELWSEIREIFSEVISDFDFVAKPDKIAVTVIGRVKNGLRKVDSKYSSIIEEGGAELMGAKQPVFDLSFLNLLVDREIITELDKTIIVETRIHKESFQALSDELGISYDALRKQRQRVEKRIINFMLEQKRLYAEHYGLSIDNISFQKVIFWLLK